MHRSTRALTRATAPSLESRRSNASDAHRYWVGLSPNRENARRYRRSSALTAYREFPGRSHFTVGQPGWEEVADYALSWALTPTVVGRVPS